jgi:hypothetical protein
MDDAATCPQNCCPHFASKKRSCPSSPLLPLSSFQPTPRADTEIDFSTYLQQAELFLKGERDYSRIGGESGLCVCVSFLPLPLPSLTLLYERKITRFKRPLTPNAHRYPATHLYTYSLLHALVKPIFGPDPLSGTPGRIVGGHLERAQWAFAGVYVVSLACVMVVYSRGKKVRFFSSSCFPSVSQASPSFTYPTPPSDAYKSDQNDLLTALSSQ